MKKLAILLVTVLMALGAQAQEIQNFQGARNVKSPEIAAGKITFRFNAPKARKVSVQPSWLGYGADAATKGQMTQGPDGIWSVTFDLPKPELYTYTFNVDGVSVLDPNNIFVQRDGTRYMSAVLIDGDFASLYKEAEHGGNIEEVMYYSETPGMYRRMYVYTPFGYDRNNKKKTYPVLYLLHGGGGDEDAWSTLGRTRQILDNLIEQGKAAPMLVVMPNGNPTQHAAATLQIPENKDVKAGTSFDNYESLPNDIVPYIEKNYNVIKNRKGRAVAGLSMGGGQSFYLGFRHNDLFANVGMFSSGLMGGITGAFDAETQMPGLMSNPKKYNNYDCIYLSCGVEDNRIEGIKKFYNDLKAKGYDNLYYEDYEGGHEWRVWRRNLTSFVQKIFK